MVAGHDAVPRSVTCGTVPRVVYCVISCETDPPSYSAWEKRRRFLIFTVFGTGMQSIHVEHAPGDQNWRQTRLEPVPSVSLAQHVCLDNSWEPLFSLIFGETAISLETPLS